MKKINLIILGVSAAVAIGAGMFLIKPAMDETTVFENKKNQSDDSISSFRSVKKTLEAQNKIKEGADMDKVRAAIPADPGIPDLLVQIQALAAGSGVAITNFSFQIMESGNSSFLSASDDALKGKAGGSEFSTVGISIAISGAYSSIKSFISAVENNLRIMDITALDVAGPKNAESLEMSANMEIAAYYEPSEDLEQKPGSILQKEEK